MAIASEIEFLEDLENRLVIEDIDLDTIIDILRNRIDKLDPTKKHFWNKKG